MISIATVTYHSSYNYGSNLQAYALQTFVENLDKGNINYEIINLRTDAQKELYKLPFEKTGVKNLLRSIIYLPYKNSLKNRNKLSEKFICEKLNITCEFSSSEEFRNFDYDYYISGGDQIWNLAPLDFDWSYYLEFVKSGKRISYATSFGPIKQNWSEKERNRVKEALLNYDYLSVREEGSYNNVLELTGITPEINIDPTLLLTKNDWLGMFDSQPIIKGKYILLYDLKSKNETYDLAKKISKALKIKVVVTQYNLRCHLLYPFEKHYDTGPAEFLNLIYNAELVLSSSFHGTVFSILLNKPFFAINGLKDFRINTLLKAMRLEKRSIDSDTPDEIISGYRDVDFTESEAVLVKERAKSELYLKTSLGLN